MALFSLDNRLNQSRAVGATHSEEGRDVLLWGHLVNKWNKHVGRIGKSNAEKIHPSYRKLDLKEYRIQNLVSQVS